MRPVRCGIAYSNTNKYFVAGYNLFDIGAPYSASFGNTPVIFRLAVENVADRHYWSTIAPSNLTGANAGSLLAYLGSPRMVLAITPRCAKHGTGADAGDSSKHCSVSAARIQLASDWRRVPD